MHPALMILNSPSHARIGPTIHQEGVKIAKNIEARMENLSFNFISLYCMKPIEIIKDK